MIWNISLHIFSSHRRHSNPSLATCFSHVSVDSVVDSAVSGCGGGSVANVGGAVHWQFRPRYSPYQPGVPQVAELSNHYDSGQHILPNLEHLFSGKG